MMMTRRIVLVAAVLFGLGSVTPATAQNFPERPIKLIVPFPAGGSVDAMARLIAQQLSAKFGPVLVENSVGAGATIGARAVAAAEPDGYTLLFGSAGALCMAPALYSNAGYDLIKSFTPVATVSLLPPVFVVGPDVPAKSIQEFVAYAKANPGKLNYGSAIGVPPHLSGAQRRLHCDCALYIGASHQNISVLHELERLPACAGVKVVMGASFAKLLVEDDASVRKILNVVNRRAAFHCEDEYRLRERVGLRVAGDVHSHAVWRDDQCALICTQRLIALARETGKSVHVVHLSTAQEMEFLAAHRDIATIEVTPHHLTLAAPDCYDRLGTLAQINPPVRDAAHRAALWRGLNAGLVDTIGSDHTPQFLAERAKPYPDSPPGMPGVQTLVPIMLDHVNAGMRVTGWPVGTFVRGHRVMWDGALVTPAQGEAVRFV